MSENNSGAKGSRSRCPTCGLTTAHKHHYPAHLGINKTMPSDQYGNYWVWAPDPVLDQAIEP